MYPETEEKTSVRSQSAGISAGGPQGSGIRTEDVPELLGKQINVRYFAVMNHIVTHLIRIQGRVQGVGFRQFIYAIASERSVTGWIRNTSDGSVEAMLQGRPADVGSVEAACRKGPALSRVENVDCYPVDPDIRYDTFEVRHG